MLHDVAAGLPEEVHVSNPSEEVAVYPVIDAAPELSSPAELGAVQVSATEVAPGI